MYNLFYLTICFASNNLLLYLCHQLFYFQQKKRKIKLYIDIHIENKVCRIFLVFILKYLQTFVFNGQIKIIIQNNF